MPSVEEGEDVFFDTVGELFLDESVVVKADSFSNYDLWLREPISVEERRENFFSKMGFVDSENMGSKGIVQSCSIDYEERLLSERRQSNSEANCLVDYSDQDWLDDICTDSANGNLAEIKLFEKGVGDNNPIPNTYSEKKNMISLTRWWKRLTQPRRRKQFAKVFEEKRKPFPIRVEQKGKRFMECTAVYSRQEIDAHKGVIWTMKFSPDGRYLASGGEDGVVCVWRVSSKADKCCFDTGSELNLPKKMAGSHVSMIVPEKVLHIEEEPLHKFQGHNGDVLDLAWSMSNHLLSSSTDKTVRLWQVGSNDCLGVFHHSNYVTCVQFNPVDENYFISGSIDGKVRIWGTRKRRVEDWANISDIVTAISYRPDGKGFLVGTFSGTCRFYELSDNELLLNAEINIYGKKRSSGNKITGIQFLKNDSQRVIITSEDSRIRILDGLEVVCKYKGLKKSGSQMWASLTSSGKHIISVGDDSRIYIWNYEDFSMKTSKQVKSTNSCEHFFSEGTSVVLPWSEWDAGEKYPASDDPEFSFTRNSGIEASSRAWDSERFSLANWFSMESSSRATLTWPEEKLPIWDFPSAEHDSQPWTDHLQQDMGLKTLASTWGLMFVTADMDGKIRTFRNYGFPVRS